MAKTAALLAATLAALCLCSPAHALSNRAWVSGHGTDTGGCGSPASPCRTFQYVHDNIIAAGGEIDVLDPAGYGPVTITKALSIVNDGVGAAGVQAASGNAITINAGPNDVVTLRGVTIDGLGTGSYGILFNSGAGLTVVDCVARHFTVAGVSIQPTSGSVNGFISKVIASDNGNYGVEFFTPSGAPSVTGVIDRVTAANDTSAGLFIHTAYASGGAMTLALSNDIAVNDGYGIYVLNAA